MTAAGLVTGLDEVRQGLGLDVKPYFVGRGSPLEETAMDCPGMAWYEPLS